MELYLRRLTSALADSCSGLQALTVAFLPVTAATLVALPEGLQTLSLRTGKPLLDAEAENALVAYLGRAEPYRLQLDEGWFSPAIVGALPARTSLVQIKRVDPRIPESDFSSPAWQAAFHRFDSQLRWVELVGTYRTQGTPAPPNARVWILSGAAR